MMNLEQLAVRLTTVTVQVDHVLESAIEQACVVLERSAKSAIGTYRFGWQELAESTQKERVRLGYTADEPLLRTGDLRDSYQHNSDSHEGYVGSDDPRAAWMEWGTRKMPARPVLWGALVECESEITGIVGKGIQSALGDKRYLTHGD